MKILIATGLYAPDIGGPATYTAFLERHLPLEGFTLTVVPFTGVRHYPRVIRHLVYLWRVLWQSRGVNVLYALDTVSVGVPVRIASLLSQKPYYLRVPGDYAWEQGQSRYGITQNLDEYLRGIPTPFQVRVLAYLQRLVASGARKVIVPSEYMKTVVSLWGVPSSKIVVIPSAVHSVSIKESKDTLRAQFGYYGFVVLTACRLVPWKGVEALINVIVRLRAQGIMVHLDIVGEGFLFEKLKRHIERADAHSYISLRGKEDTTTLLKRIKAADVFVLNTAYEGLSHQILEAMMIGTPVITTPVGGNPDLVIPNKTGLSVSYNNEDELGGAIDRIRKDASLCRQLSLAAESHIRPYEESVVVLKIVEFFTAEKEGLAKGA